MKQKLLFILAILSLNLAKAQEFEEAGIKYNITSGSTVEVIANSPVYSGAITIPSTITYSGSGIIYSVTGIGANAFNNGTITSVIIPNSVIIIGNYAFNNCLDLESVSVAVADPDDITLGVHVFNFVPFSTATLTVPIGSEAAYKTAAQWSSFDAGTIAGGTLSTNNYILESAFSVYPNPIQSTLFIKQNEAFELESVSVYTIQGKRIFNTSEKTIDFSGLPTGLYLVKLTTDLGSVTKQFIKE